MVKLINKTSSLLFLFLIVSLLSFVMTGTAMAKKGDPALPAPLETLKQEGAQIRYLGKSFGMDGWITMKGGQEQYFYVTPDGSGMVMGLLFDKNGKIITLDQINSLREKEGDVLDMFASGESEEKSPYEGAFDRSLEEFKSKPEQLFHDVEQSNWIRLGDSGAPYIYTFIDPQCPHCHAFIKDIKDNYINNGLIQVRIIPIGFRSETAAQAAFLLAVADPERSLYRHIDGDETALPVVGNINRQGVQKNLSIMQSWKLNSTPLTIYRGKNKEVKIIQGRVKDMGELISDLIQQ
jgi:protein-disulfide isomerase